jgi:signal transduction histidine kinase
MAAVDILQDLMTISKIECNHLVLHKQMVGVKAYIHEGVAAFAAEAREKQIRVEVAHFLPELSRAMSRNSGTPRNPLNSLGVPFTPRGMLGRRLSSMSAVNGGLFTALPARMKNVTDIVDSDVVSADKLKLDQVGSRTVS